MAALSKRDIEMIFRAETDAAQRPVNELTSDVKNLRKSLADLQTESNKTDKSLDALAKTTRDLEKAQDELATARTLVTQLNAQATALERAEQAADKAGKKYTDLKAQVDGAEAPTKRLTNSLAAAERGMNASNARLDEAKKNYAEVKTTIEGIIGPVENFQDAFRQIAVTQREVSQGLASAKQSMGEFRQEITKTAAEADKLSNLNTFKADAASSGLPTAQIDYISQFENRVELLAQAKRELVSQDAAFQKALQAQDARIGEDNVSRLRAAFEATAEAEARLAQTDAFRKLAADSVAAADDLNRVRNSAEAGQTSFQKLAQTIQGIVNPTAEASKSLDGMDAALDAAITKLNSGKLRPAEFGLINNTLAEIQAGLVRTAGEVDKFVAAQARVDDSAKAYAAVEAKVRALAAAVAQGGAGSEKLATDLNKANGELLQLGRVLDADTAKLNELAAALKRVGVDTNNVPAAMQRIEQSATRAAPAIKKVADTLQPGGKKGFLGLNPYELQNLGYQVNDVFTSLGSGAPIMQVFAQQAGQILQIFPGVFSTIASLAPIILPLAVAFGTLAAAMAQASTEAQTLRQGATIIASLGETGGATAQTFVDLTEKFRLFGASVEDARASAETFIKNGLNPKYYDDFAIAAANLAEVTGTDLKTATEEVTTAFTAGADEVLKLDDKYGFLTDTQRTQIEASKDTKTETEEVRKAFTQLFGKMQDGANAMNTDYKDAVNTLDQAWHDFLGTLADTGVVDAMRTALANLLTGASATLNFLREAKKQMDTNKVSLNPFNADFWKPTAPTDTRSVGQLWESAEKATLKQMAESRRRLTAAQGATGTAGANLGGGTAAAQKEREKQAAKDRKEAAAAAKRDAKAAESEAKKRQREAEALARQQANEADSLSASLNRATADAMKGQEAPLAKQLENARAAVDEQFKALEDRLADFKAKFGGDAKINGQSQSDYAAALQSQKDQIKLNKELAVYESNINDILKGRDTQLKSIKEQQDAGLLSAQDALTQTQEVTSKFGPQIDAAIESARQFIATLTPSNGTQALLDKFARIQAQGAGTGGGDTEARKSASSGLAQQEKSINQIFAQRAALVDAANKLYDLGAINFTEKEARIKDAYNQTSEALKTQIEQMRQFLIANQGLFSPETFALAMAQLEEYNTKLTYTDQLTKNVKQAATDAIAGGITNMFDTLAQGIANVITGAGTFKDLLGDLGNAALSFAATFAKAIADAIIQLAALRIAKSLIGGFHGGGTVGDLGGGVMRLSRSIGPADLSGVPRYHSGTEGAGLKSNEMLAVLQKGEKVQTEEQQAQEKNRLKRAQAGGGGATGLRQVLAFGDDQVAAAMQGNAGEQVTVTHLRRNVPLIKQLLKD